MPGVNGTTKPFERVFSRAIWTLMVNLLLYGTSFTKQPRIKVDAFTEASRAGILRARVDDLVAGLRSPGDNERLTFLNSLLRSQGIDPSAPGETGVFIYNNVLRVIQEMGTLAKRAEEARRLTQPDVVRPDVVRPDVVRLMQFPTRRQFSTGGRGCSVIVGFRWTPTSFLISPSNRPCAI